jgi:hypothetical protein
MSPDERIIELLEELVSWARLSAREPLMRVLRDVLQDARHAKAYDLSDGHRSQKEIGEQVGLSQPTISRLWQHWNQLGIVHEKNGRMQHLLKTSELGLSADNLQPEQTDQQLRGPRSTGGANHAE